MKKKGQDDGQKGPPPTKKPKKNVSNIMRNSTRILRETDLVTRVTELEKTVRQQNNEIEKLKGDCAKLVRAAEELQRALKVSQRAGVVDKSSPTAPSTIMASKSRTQKKSEQSTFKPTKTKGDLDHAETADIFGRAPSSVIEAADAAGEAILSGVKDGVPRMLVDVRDAELTRNPETLVEFLELAILPVAAGLASEQSTTNTGIRNRLKIVFPTIEKLLEYRRNMALAAPEVVALSVLRYFPIANQDQLIVIVAPAPDDEQGLNAMNEILKADFYEGNQPLNQPIVVINTHMVPLTGPAAHFEVAYHLRLLSVQYASRNTFLENLEEAYNYDQDYPLSGRSQTDDRALEAAMKHAQQVGINRGITRAMVIRAHPKPWHIFVDTSPESDANFEVAATFDEEPTTEEIDRAIIECLEGSDREDELVAQQMQQALKSGQLDRVMDMFDMSSDVVVDVESNETGKVAFESGGGTDKN